MAGYGPDGTHGDSGYRVEARYELQRINWKLLDGGAISLHRLNPAGRGESGTTDLAALGETAFDAGTVLLGVDGGARHDQFAGASPWSRSVSGAELHALQLASLIPGAGYGLSEHRSWSLLADVGVGLGFLLGWAFVKSGSDALRQHVPQARALVDVGTALAPPMLAAGLGWLSIYQLAPWLLEQHDVWLNSVYVLVGLVMHAYAEAWNSHRQHHDRGSRWARLFIGFSFRAVHHWRAAPPWLPAVPAFLALAICAAGIWVLLESPDGSGRPAAAAAAGLIGTGLLLAWRRT